jgi:hypothetical protein
MNSRSCRTCSNSEIRTGEKNTDHPVSEYGEPDFLKDVEAQGLVYLL